MKYLNTLSTNDELPRKAQERGEQRVISQLSPRRGQMPPRVADVLDHSQDVLPRQLFPVIQDLHERHQQSGTAVWN